MQAIVVAIRESPVNNGVSSLNNELPLTNQITRIVSKK